MKRKFTIKTVRENGQENTEVFTSKNLAKAYCSKMGSLYANESLDVTLIVQCGSTVQTERFTKPPRVPTKFEKPFFVQ